MSTLAALTESMNQLKGNPSITQTEVRVYSSIIIVEPLIKDILNKGHLPIKDTCFDLMLVLLCII